MRVKLIEAENVSKKVKDGKREVSILDGVSLSVYKGEMLAITGKSGSGKTSLLSILAGIDPPTAGRVIYMGEDIYRKSRKGMERFRLHETGLVFQNYNLVSELTCMQNVELPAIFSDGRRAGMDEVMDVLDRVGLKEKRNLYPAQMSGGEQQRAAIARALVNGPSVIFADEPTGSLDSKNADNVIRILQGVKEERGAAVVIVTHDMDVAGRCDRRLELSDGKMAQGGERP